MVVNSGSYKSCFLTEQGRKKLKDALKRLGWLDCSHEVRKGMTGKDSKTFNRIFTQIHNHQEAKPVNRETLESLATKIREFAPKDEEDLMSFELKQGKDYESRSTDSSTSQEGENSEDPKDVPSPPTESVYIERPPLEKACWQEIQQDGALLRIKAPHKMGKTLLLKQILNAPQVQEYQKVRLDLQLLNSSNLSDSSQFLRWLCQRVSKRLKWESCLDEYWDGMTPNASCTDYFEEYILEKLDNPLVLAIDNIDRIFAPEFHTIAQDFFGLLRSWWGFAQTTGGNWKKLRLIVIYSTEELPQLDTYQSPFNVGCEVKILEFNKGQISELAQQYQLDLSSAQVQEMKEQIGGHPYLVHEAIKHLKQNPSVTVTYLLTTAATDEGIYASHWQHLWSILEKNPDLARQLNLIVNSEGAVTVTPTYLYKLDSMGLIKKVGNQVQPRCPLYRQYFRERLPSLKHER